MPAALENLCARLGALLDTGVCPILVAALMHHGIAAVHPFLNGNGRTSRVAASLAAVAAPDACRVRFSAVFGSDPERYYEVVRRSFLRPDRLPEWIAFLAESTSGSVDPVDLGCGAAGSCGHRFSVPEVVAEYGTFLEEMEALARASAPDDHRRP